MKKYIYKIKAFLIVSLICSILSTTALAVAPYLTKLLFDSISKGNNTQLMYLIIIYIACNLLSLGLSYGEMLYNWKASIDFEMSLKQDFFKAITNYSYKRFSSKDVGEYISLQGNEITQLEMDYLTPILDIFKSISIFIIYGIMFFAFIDWRIALVMILSSMAATLISPHITSKQLSLRQKKYLDNMGQYVSKIKDLLDGFKLIQSKTRNNILFEQNKFLRDTAKFRFNYGKQKTLAYTIDGGFIYLLHIICFAMVGYLLFKKEITIGTAVATFGYIECFISPIQSLTYDINMINSTKDIKKKVLDFMAYDNSQSKLTSKNIFYSNIEFKNVSIQYKTFSLKDFSYKFEKGKKYAIIGHSGSGKSTIINSLMKYVEVSKGSIAIDGENINTLDTANIISCINQSEHIFASNFVNNITIFNSYNLTNIDFIKEKIDKKMLSSITEKENCNLLSGGEKQVLSIIRILLTNTPIYIMDEIFSATDMNTTKKLQNFLLSLEDKTMIMITHKLSQDLSMFDEILLMEDGKLIQNGSYDYICNSIEFKTLQSSF